ncbi:uncharacterized protein F4817DRAFT_326911 [Daldinia loculata]|uniref:uncharacterized protein n=1 Tax=Daldinia loculata TaxID=103429 RepID=UPI0020C45802|nr:uncharacterized protein F4817DRAFT_326911 [Daldinia loculata]KAI1650661.1 hypothetical protein F4817DRAFT_326911 [Daldinia loculata]
MPELVGEKDEVIQAILGGVSSKVAAQSIKAAVGRFHAILNDNVVVRLIERRHMQPTPQGHLSGLDSIEQRQMHVP